MTITLEKKRFFLNYITLYESIRDDIIEYLNVSEKDKESIENLVFYLLWSLEKGNLSISLKSDYNEAFKELELSKDHPLSLKNDYEVFKNYINKDNFKNLFHIHNNYLFFKKHFDALQTLKKRISKIKQKKPKKLDQNQIEIINGYFSQLFDSTQLFHSTQGKPDEIQLLAILLSVYQDFLVISGGPGTGKTFIASHIIGLHLKLGYEPHQIAIAAPTGRASSRLKESIDENLKSIFINESSNIELIQQFTIHRLLKFYPKKNEFQYHSKNRLPYRFVLVDEASMIDIFLIEKLFLALPEENFKIIFLGDKNQLPSVLEGNVLEDLIYKGKDKSKFFDQIFKKDIQKLNFMSSGKTDFYKNLENYQGKSSLPFFVELKKSYRSKPDIKEIADYVIEGNKQHFEEKLNRFKVKHQEIKNAIKNPENVSSSILWMEPENKEEVFSVIEAFVNNKYQKLQEELQNIQNKEKEEWKVNQSEIRKVYDEIQKNKILVPTKVGELGTQAIRQYIIEKVFNLENLKPGFPILITSNDYFNQLFNGDIGIILQDKKKNFYACFERKGEFLFYSLLSLNEYEISFAMTIHKSQGSEYEEVLLILPDIDEESKNLASLMDRKIIYTAITRAKNRLYIISKKETLEFVLKQSNERITGIDLWEDEI